MARFIRCARRAELATELARELSQQAAQAGAALQMHAHCHIDRGVLESYLVELRRVVARAEKLADEFDCADRVAAEAA